MFDGCFHRVNINLCDINIPALKVGEYEVGLWRGFYFLISVIILCGAKSED